MAVLIKTLFCCLGASGVTLIEAINAAGCVYEFLFSRKKWMALGANFDMQFFSDRRARGKGISTCTGYRNFLIIRMNFCFHFDCPTFYETGKL